MDSIPWTPCIGLTPRCASCMSTRINNLLMRMGILLTRISSKVAQIFASVCNIRATCMHAQARHVQVPKSCMHVQVLCTYALSTETCMQQNYAFHAEWCICARRLCTAAKSLQWWGTFVHAHAAETWSIVMNCHSFSDGLPVHQRCLVVHPFLETKHTTCAESYLTGRRADRQTGRQVTDLHLHVGVAPVAIWFIFHSACVAIYTHSRGRPFFAAPRLPQSVHSLSTQMVSSSRARLWLRC